MSDLMRCGGCAYWRAFNATVGLCRRSAPRCTADPPHDMIAHWPETFATDGCGDGVPRDGARTESCHGCAFWLQSRFATGLEPEDRGDRTWAWWREAGRCARHAPQPLANPGTRTIWPATHQTDGCGEGAARAADAPPPWITAP